MHEMPITENILRLVLAEAARHGATRVVTITLVVGALSSVVDESVRMYFDLLSEGTAAEGARLEFRHVPATWRCPACAQTFTETGEQFTCPACGERAALTGDAKEFYIESIEVESCQ